jgi:hypothetical protein
MTPGQLRAGDVLRLGRTASVQFVPPILFRLIRVLPHTTYEGWVWLDGYELSPQGDAIERREVFVQLAGLHRIANTLQTRPRNGGPADQSAARRTSRSS